MKIGFVGLGQMGSGIARNLLQAGHELTVYNRTASKSEPLREAGAKVAQSAGETASGSEAVITMLADDNALEEVVFGPGKLLDALDPGAAHISMSTVSVELSRKMAAAHRDRNQDYIAAPVFGRPDAAAAAKLFVVVAGSSPQLDRFRAIFHSVGQKVFEVGEKPEAASLFKITGNFLITNVLEGLSEAFALIRKSGHDPIRFLEVMTGSLFSAPIYQNYGRIVANEEFEPAGFKLPLGLKDNRLVLAAAQEKLVPMPTASLVRDHFLAAIAQGLGEKDWSAIAEVVYKNAGLQKAGA